MICKLEEHVKLREEFRKNIWQWKMMIQSK
jgi:hypothetical protein